MNKKDTRNALASNKSTMCTINIKMCTITVCTILKIFKLFNENCLKTVYQHSRFYSQISFHKNMNKMLFLRELRKNSTGALTKFVFWHLFPVCLLLITNCRLYDIKIISSDKNRF